MPETACGLNAHRACSSGRPHSFLYATMSPQRNTTARDISKPCTEAPLNWIRLINVTSSWSWFDSMNNWTEWTFWNFTNRNGIGFPDRSASVTTRTKAIRYAQKYIASGRTMKCLHWRR